MKPLLEVANLVARYGQIVALRDVSLRVGEGEAVALVGANGAGKSTLIKCIMGLVRASSGAVSLGGVDLLKRPISDRATLGIGYAPEGRRIFPGLTVQENLLVASRERDNGRKRADDVYEIFPALEDKRDQLGWSLSGGQQQMLAIGRALMPRPRLLLLDEPSLGLAPLLTTEVFTRIDAIAKSGTAVLLAEQNVHKALQVSHRAYVIKLGAVTKSSAARELAADNDLTGAYLGA
ncbi:MAG TPA: ABC transporter ATP-binding protein [Casimicrobiaceae bacterium]|nr:ABC transporter ATP-binding protein [Casimicrobiaceae bacterium]